MNMNEPMPPMTPNMDMQGDMGSNFDDNGELDAPDNPNGKSDSEIDDIFSKLDTEKQAAVIKYAKSMIDDNDEPNNDEVDEALVTEITNNILDDMNQDTEDVEDTKIRNKKVTKDNPFLSKTFNKK